MNYSKETLLIHPDLYAGNVCDLTNDKLGCIVSKLEKGKAGVSLNSFQGAIITCMLSLVKTKDHILASNGLPSNVFAILENVFHSLGIETTVFDSEASQEGIKSQIKENTKLILIPSINLPSMEVSDMNMFSDICKEASIPLIIDNTLASPYIIKPIEHGANIVIQNTNPYIAANKELSAGIIVDACNFDWAATNKFETITHTDPNIDEINFYEVYKEKAFIAKAIFLANKRLGYNLRDEVKNKILLRIETLEIRMKKICSSSLELATYLSFHPKVDKVCYPLLPNQKHNARNLKYLNNGGAGYITLLLKGKESNHQQLIDSLDFIKVSTTTGNLETVIPPVNKGQRMIPISLGLENIQDIKNVFELALDKITE
ncbi:PLP-dependent transferase [Mycoplasma sp. P36-A1]|uniref:PLP-dependent transferase n=1 Tax=Mycoplasma sp. P36-A1 TaxID=3252900 RepID=UPI003C2E65EF